MRRSRWCVHKSYRAIYHNTAHPYRTAPELDREWDTGYRTCLWFLGSLFKFIMGLHIPLSIPHWEEDVYGLAAIVSLPTYLVESREGLGFFSNDNIRMGHQKRRQKQQNKPLWYCPSAEKRGADWDTLSNWHNIYKHKVKQSYGKIFAPLSILERIMAYCLSPWQLLDNLIVSLVWMCPNKS